MRILLLAAVCWIGATVAIAQQPPTVAKPQPTAADKDKDDADNKRLMVYRLQYVRSTDALRLIKELGIGGVDLRITSDNQTNSLLVLCNQESHKKIDAILEEIDHAADIQRKEEDDSVQLLRLPSAISGDYSDLVAKYAQISNASTAYDQETGVVMIRGNKSQVQKTAQVLEEIQKIAMERVKRETVRSRRPVAFRLFWLTSQPQANTLKSDGELDKIIARLGGLGFEGLRVGMHLVARCDLATSGASKCFVEGSEQIEGISRKLSIEASVKSENDSDIAGKFQIRTNQKSDSAAPVESSVMVDVNLVVKKYYVLAAAPLGRYHSVFVVQYIDDL